MIRHTVGEETRFEEGEVRRLLARAMELKSQAEREGARISETGEARFTLGEIAQIAAEVGIEPRWLEAAAMERAGGSASGRRFYLLGGPTTIQRDVFLPGTVTPEKWERIVPELRRATGKVGQLEQIGRSFSWTSPQEFDHVALVPEADGTRLTIQSDPFLWFIIYMTGIIGYMVGIGAVVSLPFTAAVEALLAAGVIGGIFSLQRRLMGRLMRGHEKAIDSMVARIAAILAEE